MSALRLLVNTGLTRVTGGGGGDPEGLITSLSSLGNPATPRNFHVGWVFSPTVNLSVTGLRVRMTGGDSEIVRLWRVSDKALLATSGILNSDGTNWAEDALPTPVALIQGAQYMVSTRRSDGGSRIFNSVPLGAIVWSGLGTYISSQFSTSAAYPGTFDSVTHATGLCDVIAAPA